MNKSSVKKWAVEIVGAVVLFALVYYGNHYLQRWLGAQALEQVQLENVSFEQAKLQSAQQGKLVLLEFGALWCPGCRKLDRNVLADDKVKAKIESKYIFSRLDFDNEAHKTLFAQYRVEGFPTLLVVDSQGALIERLPLSYDPETFLRYL